MRGLARPTWPAALLAACCLAACGEDEPAGPANRDVAEVVAVSVDPDGPAGKKAARVELGCFPGSGDLGCRTLAAAPAATWRPVPVDRACTELFGGPQTARVTGVVGGRRLDARFSRRNGCEIERWDALAPLLDPLAGGG